MHVGPGGALRAWKILNFELRTKLNMTILADETALNSAKNHQ